MDTKEEATAPRLSHSRRLARTLITIVWISMFVVMPLSLGPAVFMARDGSALANIPAFRAQFVAWNLLTATMVLAFIAPWTFQTSRFRLATTPVWVVPALGLVGWLLLSTPFSNLAPWIPALGSQERMDGTLVQGMWFLLPVVSAGLAVLGATREHVIRRFALVAALSTAVWSFLQGVGMDPVTWLSRAGVYFDIPAGAFGHGALATAFLVFVMLVCWTAWIHDGDRLRTSVLATFVLGLGIAAAGGRAAVGGLAIGALVLMAINLRQPARQRRLLILGLAAVLGALVSYTVVPRAQRQAAAAGAAIVGVDGSLNARFPAWKGGVRLLLANPFFGVGAEGFGYGVWEYVDRGEAALLIRSALGSRISPDRLAEGDYEISGNVIAFTSTDGEFTLAGLRWDKAHNYLIDLGLTAGLPAVVLFMAFVALGQFALWRSESIFARGVAVAWISFLVFGVAWFGTISLDPVVWAMVGTGLGYAHAQSRSKRPAILPVRTRQGHDNPPVEDPAV